MEATGGDPRPQRLEHGGILLSSGVLCWVATPTMFRGKVTAELCLGNAHGAMFIVALNRLRLIHLSMFHLGHECECQDAIRMVDLIQGGVFVQSFGAGKMTTLDWEFVSQMVYGTMLPDSQEDVRVELASIRLTGKHREPIAVGTGL